MEIKKYKPKNLEGLFEIKQVSEEVDQYRVALSQVSNKEFIESIGAEHESACYTVTIKNGDPTIEVKTAGNGKHRITYTTIHQEEF